MTMQRWGGVCRPAPGQDMGEVDVRLMMVCEVMVQTAGAGALARGLLASTWRRGAVRSDVEDAFLEHGNERSEDGCV
ncbi:hypothetical protein EA187_07800 [Lujinxingia sediminis]|uniref:Uncharacterized protein n=1 Tax=Lujinxingia sediminis TaxID=2480984 RepID=A0ABY0CVC6_9DELT|nr:hypothetical protein [Lujinxingia sediminis]RVU47026.1 hypothetical protein EA187_07800 [Lujinxingia sediminis]